MTRGLWGSLHSFQIWPKDVFFTVLKVRLFHHVSVALLAVAMLLPGVAAAEAGAKPPAKATPKPALCVDKIHVIYGCKTCEAMLEWLKKGGVKVEMTDVQTGPYKLYPTVIYSDRSTDYGEQMYRHDAKIPEKLCVIRCNVGTE